MNVLISKGPVGVMLYFILTLSAGHKEEKQTWEKIARLDEDSVTFFKHISIASCTEHPHLPQAQGHRGESVRTLKKMPQSNGADTEGKHLKPPGRMQEQSRQRECFQEDFPEKTVPEQIVKTCGHQPSEERTYSAQAL